MKNKPATPLNAPELRRQAEAKLSERKKREAAPPATESDTRHLVQELEVHQIELEMQNEELLQSRAQVEAGLRQYTDLYDFAPVGYFMLARDGAIHQVNLAGANLLGVERGKLIKRRFGALVSVECRSVFNAFLEKVFLTSGSKETCEVALQKDGSAPLWVHIEATWSVASGGEREVCHAVVSDITERKRAEEALRESEERFRAIASNTPDHILMQDRDLRYTFVVNPQLGLNETDMVGKTDRDFLEKEETEHLIAIKRKVLETGKPVHVETPLRNLKGETEFFDGSYIPKFDSTGNVDGLIGYFRNITERKRAEQLIEEERNLLRSIINAIPDEIGVKDLERNFVLANEGLLRALGKQTLDQVMGFRDEDLISERYARDAREKEIHVLTSGETLFNYIPEPRRNPSTGELERVIMSTKTPLHNRSGRTIGLVMVNRNITDLQRTQEALSQSENRFRTVWSNSLDAMRLTDADGNIVMVNQSYCQLFKKEREEIVGRSLADTYLPKLGENISGDYCERFRNRTTAPILEAEVTLWNGEELSLEISNTFLSVPDQPELLLSVFRDITERKRAEERLKATQEQLHRLAGHLQSVREEERKHLSQEFHDQLGQSLTALKMDLSMLHRSVTDPGKELSRTILALGIESMQGMIDKAIGIIREILSELRPELLDQLGIVPTLEWEVERFQRHSGISCTFNSEVEEIALGEKKSIALYRIFQEALTNVARHAKATNVEVALRKESDNLILEIKDNGVGIAADAEQKGRSFGLIGMRERAILLGGTLEIRGVEGKGTTIFVRIPYEQTLADGGVAL
ncbi:MAG: PAS domain S-box protein [Ignavibacteria bacterium]|nr:PAS domain S-box protein [Ignavibacteria bacterium]